MVNMRRPRILEKYGYETNSLSVNAGKFLLGLVGVAVVYLSALALWMMIS